MRTCNLCKSAMGDVVQGRRIQLSEYGICTVCMAELEKLEGKYKEDFEARSGNRVEWIIPWPAFKQFSWPPYHAVIVSGWQFQKHEFGMAFTDDIIVAGRRSIQSFEDEMLTTVKDLTMKLESSKDPGEKMMIRRELKKWQRRLEKAEELLKQGDRQLFIIPIDRIKKIIREESPDWIKVRLHFVDIKDKFFGGKKEVEGEEFFIVSQLYREAVDFLSGRVRQSGGTVETVQVEDQK